MIITLFASSYHVAALSRQSSQSANSRPASLVFSTSSSLSIPHSRASLLPVTLHHTHTVARSDHSLISHRPFCLVSNRHLPYSPVGSLSLSHHPEGPPPPSIGSGSSTSWGKLGIIVAAASQPTHLASTEPIRSSHCLAVCPPCLSSLLSLTPPRRALPRALRVVPCCVDGFLAVYWRVSQTRRTSVLLGFSCEALLYCRPGLAVARDMFWYVSMPVLCQSSPVIAFYVTVFLFSASFLVICAIVHADCRENAPPVLELPTIEVVGSSIAKHVGCNPQYENANCVSLPRSV